MERRALPLIGAVVAVTLAACGSSRHDGGGPGGGHPGVACRSDADCLHGYLCDPQRLVCVPRMAGPGCPEIWFTASQLLLFVHGPNDFTAQVGPIDRTRVDASGMTPPGLYTVTISGTTYGVQAQLDPERGLVKALFDTCPPICVLPSGVQRTAEWDPTACQDDDCDGYGPAGHASGCKQVPAAVDPDDGDWRTYPGAPEICDGKDNDGNGLIDTADPGFQATPCPLQSGVCQGSIHACTDGVLQACDYGPSWVSEEGPASCDGLDNDCDGDTDEECAGCENGSTTPCGMMMGVCRRGTQTCADGMWGECVGEIGPSPEICDGLDNDCDGRTDELPDSEDGHVCGAKCPSFYTLPIIATVQGRDVTVCVDRYEASHRDAATSFPASLPGMAPWVNVSFADAQRACSMDHKVLCPIEVWTAACGGWNRSTYPYGVAFQAGTCNGDDATVAPEPTGSRPGCLGEWDGRGDNPDSGKIWDMSGNVKEWVAPPLGDNLRRFTMGGAYASPPDGLTCTSQEEHADGAGAPDIGFRCCSALPL